MTRMRLVVLSFLVFASIEQLQAQESAQYLQNAIRDLRNMKGRQTLKRVDTQAVQAIVPEHEPTIQPTQIAERRIQNKSVPPLSLTKGELAALYEAALSKGDTIKLDTGDNSFIHAAVHEIDDGSSYNNDQKESTSSGDMSGYYYYYYPVKSFLDEMTSQSSSHEYYYSKPSHHDTKRTTTEKPQYQYHSHTHQHNVKITSTKEVATEKKDKKALEPLFMAISGFIGMAVMFVLSVLVFPKFGIKKSKGAIKGVKKSERITDIARVALQAIEGKDCGERFACELEKTARAFNLQDNRFVKLLKRMAPGSFGKQMDKVGKYSNKRLRCTAIPCKKKNNPMKKKAANAGAQKKP